MKTKNRLQGVSTFRWDTTYTTTYKIINESIRQYSASPTDFSNHAKPATLKRALANGRFLNYSTLHHLFLSVSENASVLLSGEWKQWSLELRGNGNVISVGLPIKTGHIKLPGFGEGDLSDGYIVVDIKLQIIGTDTKSVIVGNKPDMEVIIHEHTFPHIEKGSVMDMLIDGTFREYLNSENVIEQFKHVFSTASINDKATGDFAWLTPSDLSYAVFAPDYGATENNCLYSMLCMTDNNKAPLDIQKSVDSEVFKGKAAKTNAVLCISPQKFSEHVLIEASKNLILGSQESDYAYSTDGMEVYNVNEIIMRNVEIKKGKKVNLKIAAGNYNIRIQNDHLETFITDATYHESLYDVYINFHQKIKFRTKKIGENTYFIPEEDKYYDAVTHVTIEPTELAEILQWVGIGLDILGALLCLSGIAVSAVAKVATTATRVAVTAETAAIAAEAAVVSETASAIVKGTIKGISVANALLIGGAVCTLVGIGLSLTSTIAKAIAQKDYSKIPTLESFAANLLSQLKWTGIKEAELLGARLNDAFLLDYQVHPVKALRAEISPEIRGANWKKYYEPQITFEEDGKSYCFSHSHTDNRWFMAELSADWNVQSEIKCGTWQRYYEVLVSFTENGKNYLLGQSASDKSWFISELSTSWDGQSKIRSGNWPCLFNPLIPFPENGKTYVFGQSITDKKWFISELSTAWDGKMEVKDDFRGCLYEIAIPFIEKGKNYIFGHSSTDNRWYISELTASWDGQSILRSGSWKRFYQAMTTCEVAGKSYLFGQSKADNRWFISELSSSWDGQSELGSGKWKHFYGALFTFEEKNNTYLFGQSESDNRCFMSQILIGK